VKERGCRARCLAKHRRGVRSKALKVSEARAHRAHVTPIQITERRDRLQLISRPVYWHSIRAAITHGARSIRNRNCATSERHIAGVTKASVSVRRGRELDVPRNLVRRGGPPIFDDPFDENLSFVHTLNRYGRRRMIQEHPLSTACSLPVPIISRIYVLVAIVDIRDSVPCDRPCELSSGYAWAWKPC